LRKIFESGYRASGCQVTLGFVVDLNRMTIRVRNPERWTVADIAVDPISFDAVCTQMFYQLGENFSATRSKRTCPIPEVFAAVSLRVERS
jgi:hypothetical protein